MQLSATARPFYRIRQCPELSQNARRRLGWLNFYRTHGRNARLTCRHFAISSRTFYKWLHRFDPKDLSSLEDRSRRPRRVRKSSLPQSTVDKIIALRQEFPAWSKYKLAVLLETRHGLTLSASTIGRLIKKHGLFLPKPRKKYLRRLKRKRERPPRGLRKASPGSLIQIDTKHLRFSDGTKVYQFTAIDTCTRLRVLRASSTASSQAAARFLDEVLDAFPFTVQNLQTDNGSEFLLHFDRAALKYRIPHFFSHPHSPKENAFVERSHRTDDDEFYHRLDDEPLDAADLNHRLRQWETVYNSLRPHASLHYLTPSAFRDTLPSGDPIRSP